METVSVADWLAWPVTRVAEVVREQHLSVKVAMDGTTRHYLLAHPNAEGRVLDFGEYAEHGRQATFGLLEMLFRCGFECVLILNVWPPDISRREDHLRRVVGASERVVLGEAALAHYARWGVRARLYGNYDISPVLASVREQLFRIDARLAEETAGDRLLLWGYGGGDGLDEVICRSAMLYERLGRLPTEAELRQACFPHGPDNLDIFIGGGWLRIGNADLPPALNRGRTDIYSLSHLPLDLSEDQVRRILYDRLFRRYVASPVDDTGYSMETLDEMRRFYDRHQGGVLGLGQLVGGGLWYPLDEETSPALESRHARST